MYININQGANCPRLDFFYVYFLEKSQKILDRLRKKVYYIYRALKILRNCVKVAQATLTRFVWVRILVPQPKKEVSIGLLLFCFLIIQTHKSSPSKSSFTFSSISSFASPSLIMVVSLHGSRAYGAASPRAALHLSLYHI